MRGTPEAFAKLATKDKDTLYFISAEDAEDGVLYLGSKLISGEGDNLSVSSIDALKDVLISEDLLDKSFLTYDAEQQLWVNTSIDKLIFVGATDSSSGIAGLVPPPTEKATNLFLRSDGTWAAIQNSESGAAVDNNILTIENVGEIIDHEVLIAEKVQDLTLYNGDIIIIKDLIDEDKWQYTAYVYDGTNWSAMDGNYSAENVYFKDDILVTTMVGTIQNLTNGQATLSAKGKNVKEVLSSLLAERKNPIAIKPTATINLTNETTTYEVGTKVIPSWKVTFSKGSYSYGPDTGVTDAGGQVTSTKDTTAVEITAGSLNEASGNFAEYQVEDNDKYYAYLTYGWNDGTSTPVDNFGDEYTDISNNLPIQAASNKTTISDKYISGFRKWFKGGLTSTSNEVALTSEIIRTSLVGSEDNVAAEEFELKAADFANCKRIVIAIPVAASKNITSVLLKSTSNVDITTEFVKQTNTVDVEGANGYTAEPYNVWIYEPAILDSTEVYTVTIG